MVNNFLVKLDKSVDIGDNKKVDYLVDILFTSNAYIRELVDLKDQEIKISLIKFGSIAGVNIINLNILVKLSEDNILIVPGYLFSASERSRPFLEEMATSDIMRLAFNAIGYSKDVTSEEFNPIEDRVMLSDTVVFEFEVSEHSKEVAKEALTSDYMFKDQVEESSFVEKVGLPIGNDLFALSNHIIEDEKQAPANNIEE